MGKKSKFNQNSNILFVGGLPKNVPPEKIRCSWQHWPEDGPKLNSRLSDLRLPEGNNAPDLVICFSAHCSHGTYGALKELAREADIPLLSSKSAGLTSFVNGAEMHYGIDISKCFDLNGKMKKTPTRELDLKSLMPDRLAWARQLPKNAVKISGPGMTYYIKSLKGKNWLTVKGDTLIEIAAEAPKGEGPTGCLTAGQVKEVKAMLMKKYGLAVAGVDISTYSIKQHIDTLRGVNSQDLARRIMGELTPEEKKHASIKNKAAYDKKMAKKHKKNKNEKSKPTNADPTESAPKKSDTDSTTPALTPQPNAGTGRRVSEAKPVTMDSFLRDMAYVMKSQADHVDRLDALYRENSSLRAEGAAYVEQVEKLEGQLKQLKDKLMSTENQLKKWKVLAASEGA